MYKAFFNLARNPFELTPDPTCFVPTKASQRGAGGALLWRSAAQGICGGDWGGWHRKDNAASVLARAVKESKDVAYAYVFNGRLSPTEFLQYILSDFGLPASGQEQERTFVRSGQVSGFAMFKKMTTVLIVDEAHLLSADILEEVRLLSNLETEDDKLLQILLVGQPELDEKLDSVGLRQLKQRIAFRTQLVPLDVEETKLYIEERLQIAGASRAVTHCSLKTPLRKCIVIREAYPA